MHITCAAPYSWLVCVSKPPLLSMDGQIGRSFSRACILWLSSLMGTRAISTEDLALLEFVLNVFGELTPGDELQRFGCDLPSVSVISTGGISDGARGLLYLGNVDSPGVKGPVRADKCAVRVVRSPDLKELQMYRVSEKLGEQSVRVKKAMFFHILNGRARGTHPLVLQRLATIRRVANLERLALFQDAEQMELVLEFLFRSLTQIPWGNSAAKERFDNLHEYSKEVILHYMEVKTKETYREDYHLVQIEEMQRHLRTQMIHEQKRMHDEMKAGQALVAEVSEKNKRLCTYFDHVVGQNLEYEVQLLRWDLALAMRALASNVMPDA